MSKQIDRRLSALVDAGLALAGDLDLDSLLQRIADLSREVLDAKYGAVGVIGDHGELTRFVYSGIDAQTADEIGDLPNGRGVLGALIEENRPLRLREISEHPRSFGFPAHHPPMNTFLGVPIVVRNRVFGRLYLTEKAEGAEFTKDDERIALTFAAQAGVALENARLVANYTAVALENERLTEALSDLAVLEERERISKELHDGVIQSIYSVGLSLQGSLTLLKRDPSKAEERVEAAIAELDNVVRDVRSYIFELQPKMVEEKGFFAAISELVRDLEVNTLAHATIDLDEAACGAIAATEKAHLLQFVRETLSNIARHAQASEVEVSCGVVGDHIELRIEDDGISFDPASVKRGQGLTNMEDRAVKLGGTLDITPREPKGTSHVLSIPDPSQGGETDG